jgi:hypothetical protein
MRKKLGSPWWENVLFNVGASGSCWEWQAGTSLSYKNDRYGCIKKDGKSHRVIVEFAKVFVGVLTA